MSHFRLVASGDGINFAEDRSYPSMFGQGELESYGIEDCRVAQIGETYYLTFTKVSEHGVGVGLRSTTDWRNILQHGMILPPHNKDCAIFGEQIGGKYYALHRPAARPSAATTSGSPNRPTSCIGAAPLSGAQPAWPVGQRPCRGRGRPIRTPAGWLEIYHGANGEHRYCLGALLLDLQQPWKVLARSRDPIMERLPTTSAPASSQTSSSPMATWWTATP